MTKIHTKNRKHYKLLINFLNTRLIKIGNSGKMAEQREPEFTFSHLLPESTPTYRAFHPEEE